MSWKNTECMIMEMVYTTLAKILLKSYDSLAGDLKNLTTFLFFKHILNIYCSKISVDLIELYSVIWPLDLVEVGS